MGLLPRPRYVAHPLCSCDGVVAAEDTERGVTAPRAIDGGVVGDQPRAEDAAAGEDGGVVPREYGLGRRCDQGGAVLSGILLATQRPAPRRRLVVHIEAETSRHDGRQPSD